MDWKEAVKALVKVAPKLAYQPQLLQAMEASTTQAKPPEMLMFQLDVVLAVAKQNQRIAELHGYATLSEYARRVEVAATEVLTQMKREGITPKKAPGQQAQSI